MAFFEAISERRLLFAKNVITFFFFAEKIQDLAREYRDTCTCFDLIVNKLVLGSFSFARAIPEVNFIPVIFAEEGFDCRS